MFSLLFFLLPIVLFFATLPLKVLLKSYKLKLKVSNGNTMAQRLYRWGSGNGNVASNKSRIGKTGVTLIKTGTKVAYKASKVAIKTAILVLKITIQLIKLICVVLFGIDLIVIIMGILLIVVAIVLLCYCYLMIEDSGGLSDSGKGGTSGTDYYNVDWSQDFSAKLSEIEATQGVTQRNWAEITIISMNTAQKKAETKCSLENFMVGFKVIESGSSNVMSNSGSETSGITPSNNLATLQTSGGGSEDDGPFQVEDWVIKDWVRFNDLYSSSCRGSEGSRYFYPDGINGIPTKFSKEAWSKYAFATSQHEQIIKAFSDCGEDLTEEKYNIILHALSCLNYADGNLDMGYVAGSMTADSNRERNKSICDLLILFMKKYGWGRSTAKTNLVTSMCTAVDSGYNSKSISPNSDLQYSLVGTEQSGPSSGTFQSCINKTGDFGVLDEKGNKIDGTLYAYLLKDAPEAVKSYILGDDNGMNRCWTTTWYKRCIYPLSVYLNSGYILDKTVDALGIRNQMTVANQSGNTGLGSSSTGDTDLVSVIKYMCETGTVSWVDRLGYTTDGDDRSYNTDCSRFVFRALIGAKMNAFGATPDQVASLCPDYDPIKSNISNLVGLGKCYTGAQIPWVRSTAPQSIVFDADVAGHTLTDADSACLEPGDICFVGYGGAHHVVFYMGKNSQGIRIKAHASTSDNNNCSNNMDALDNKKWGVGYGSFEGLLESSGDNGITLVCRPSKF